MRIACGLIIILDREIKETDDDFVTIDLSVLIKVLHNYTFNTFCFCFSKRSSIRVVKSWRAGVGKSLFKRNMVTALKERQNTMSEDTELVVTIPLYDKNIVIDEVMKILLTHTHPPHIKQPRIFHFDISHEVCLI